MLRQPLPLLDGEGDPDEDGGEVALAERLTSRLSR
jgi:hypothetical protein